MSRKRIAASHELADGGTIKIEFVRAGKRVEGFAARVRGQLVAYVNVCRHLPLSLDYSDGRFFTKDGRHFICQNHGALFEPLTGLCTRGPCEGESLKRLAVEEVDGVIWLLG